MFCTWLQPAQAQTADTKGQSCYSCSPNYEPGSAGDGGKTLGQIALISKALLKGSDSDLMSNLYSYCMNFKNGRVNSKKTLRKEIIRDMEENLPPNGKIDSYFLEAGCNPDYIGQTLSPLAHLATELPSEYTPHLEVIRKYFIEKRYDGLFTRMLNAKNTRGHTSLDYVQYLLEKRLYIREEASNIGEYISYLCSHGAVYSIYSGSKSCPKTEAIVATSVIGRIPIPAGLKLVHGVMDQSKELTELFLEPKQINGQAGALVMYVKNDGREITRQWTANYVLPTHCESAFNSEHNQLLDDYKRTTSWKPTVPLSIENKRPTYAPEADVKDIIGTEICLAHSKKFAAQLADRTNANLLTNALNELKKRRQDNGPN